MDQQDEVGDLVRLVGEAGAEDKAALYTQLGLKLTYYPEKQYVEARIDPEPPHVRAVCVRGLSTTGRTWPTTTNGYVHHIRIG